MRIYPAVWKGAFLLAAAFGAPRAGLAQAQQVPPADRPQQTRTPQADDKRVNYGGRSGTVFKRPNTSDLKIHIYLNLDGDDKSFELISVRGSDTSYSLSRREDVIVTIDSQGKLVPTDASGHAVTLENPDVIITPGTPARTDAPARPTTSQAAPVAAPPPGVVTASPPSNFYHTYQVSPIGNGEKVLITLDSGGQQFNIVAEPVTPKDGGPVTQYALYANGGVTLYSKTQVALPNPNGGEGTRVDGMSVTRLPIGSSSAAGQQNAASAGHRASSEYTTTTRKSETFRLPLRFDKPGFGMGRPRMWLMWDGQREIQVEPVQTNFGGSFKDMIPLYNMEQWATGNLNRIKFLSNAYTEGSPAPRYFYLKKNKDDSITVYGNDDLEKLKAIDKGKNR